MVQSIQHLFITKTFFVIRILNEKKQHRKDLFLSKLLFKHVIIPIRHKTYKNFIVFFLSFYLLIHYDPLKGFDFEVISVPNHRKKQCK